MSPAVLDLSSGILGAGSAQQPARPGVSAGLGNNRRGTSEFAIRLRGVTKTFGANTATRVVTATGERESHAALDLLVRIGLWMRREPPDLRTLIRWARRS